MGVPFINPVMSWSTDKPEDRSSWTWQHEGLADVKAPYVYTVVSLRYQTRLRQIGN